MPDEHARTELVWPGKHTAGAPDPSGAAHLEVIERYGAREPDPHENVLAWGDNLEVMSALLPTHVGTVDLIYADPPYGVGVGFSYRTRAGDGDDAPVVEATAYRDTWGRGMATYLDTMAPRFARMHELLSERGSLFVHCDWRSNAYLRLLLDEIFGPACFRNEIVWRRAPNLGRQAASSQLGRVTDTILVYTRTPGCTFRGEIPTRSTPVDADATGRPKGARWDEAAQAYFTTAPRGDYTDASVERLRAAGRIHTSPSGKVYVKYFLRPGDGGRWFKDQRVDCLWDDYEVRPLRHRPKHEDQGYDTQKPEGLLERIVAWGSAPGDLVADFFAGSGTTPAVAERLGRRWIACDAGHAAVHVTRKRLLAVPGVRPFAVVRPDGGTPEAGPPAGGRLDLGVHVVAGTRRAVTRLRAPAVPDTAARAGRRAEPAAWSDLLDYWAVDWHYDGGAFAPTWFGFRAPGSRTLPLASAPHEYPRPGRYTVAARAVDVFGGRAEHRVTVEIA